ncbi:MAG: cytochrome c biogenesis protein ResB [Oscillospiraceae bacterium]|nr:cytochrome c biogenesis protein ResB [Oscillospiraceae bacterium]
MKFVAFLRSMKFGIILLILVMACSLAGSLVPQDRADSWYMENYPNNMGNLVVGLGINRLFSTWYFVTLIGLLSINLLFCTIIRFGRIAKTRDSLISSMKNMTNGKNISNEEAIELKNMFAEKKYKSSEANDVIVYSKNSLGFYGSFVVHLGLLLILVFGGLVLKMSTVIDYNVNPSETITLEDGTLLTLESFRIEDETGRTEYASIINVSTPSAQSSIQREIKVNHPFTHRSHKYYQHSYGISGSITATNIKTGGWDTFYLTERSFLSGEGGRGIWYEALFPAYVIDDDGHITPLVMQTFIYPDPVYYVLVADGGGRTARFMLPGDSVQIGDVEFTFNAPAYFSGIRVKEVPHPFLELLFASFILIIIGFWLCFFHLPTLVGIGKDKYKTAGSNDGVQLEIEAFLKANKETSTQC